MMPFLLLFVLLLFSLITTNDVDDENKIAVPLLPRQNTKVLTPPTDTLTAGNKQPPSSSLPRCRHSTSRDTDIAHTFVAHGGVVTWPGGGCIDPGFATSQEASWFWACVRQPRPAPPWAAPT